MKKIAILLSLMLLIACSDNGKKFIAMVNGEGIDRPFFENEVTLNFKQIERQGRPLSDQEKHDYRQKIMDNLIDRQLLLQEVKKKNISAPEQTVNQRIEEAKKSFPNEQAFQAALAENNLTEVILRQRFQEQATIIQLIRTEVVDKIVIDEKDLKDFYEKNKPYFDVPERVRASHVLIKCEEAKCQAAAKAKIEGIRQEILSKKIAFADAAQKYSDCPSKARGGDLDYFAHGQMLPEFEKIAFAAPIGEVSKPFKTKYGYHVIVVMDKKAAGTVPFEEASPGIREQLKNEKSGKLVQEYVANMKKQSKIKTYLEPAPATAKTETPAPKPPAAQAPAPNAAAPAPGATPPAQAPSQPPAATQAPAPGK